MLPHYHCRIIPATTTRQEGEAGPPQLLQYCLLKCLTSSTLLIYYYYYYYYYYYNRCTRRWHKLSVWSISAIDPEEGGEVVVATTMLMMARSSWMSGVGLRQLLLPPPSPSPRPPSPPPMPVAVQGGPLPPPLLQDPHGCIGEDSKSERERKKNEIQIPFDLDSNLDQRKPQCIISKREKEGEKGGNEVVS